MSKTHDVIAELEASRAQEARLRRALRQAEVSYWRFSFEQDRLSYWSEAGFLGAAKDVVFHDVEDMLRFVHAEDRDRVRQAYDVLEAYTVEYRVVHPNGDVRHIRELAELEYDNDGTAIGQIGICQDVTPIRQTEAALEAARARHEPLVSRIADRDIDDAYSFENAPIAVWEEDWSELKTALERLNTNENDLGALFRKSPDIAVELTALMRTVRANPAALDMYAVPDFDSFVAFEEEDFLTDDEFESF